MKKIRSKRELILLVLMSAIIAIVLIFYVRSTQRLMIRSATYNVESQANKISDVISSKVQEAKSSLNMVVKSIEDMGEGVAPEEITRAINARLKDTPFSMLEYIDSNGYNYSIDNEKFDASSRAYYTEGIKGNSGIWINYSPHYSNEYLVDFFAPIYNNREVTGVLVGAVFADSVLKEYLKSDYFGWDMIVVLLDKDHNMITSSYDKGEEITIEDIFEHFNLTNAGRNKFLSILESKSIEPFMFEGNIGNTAACINYVDGSDWVVATIIPSKAFLDVSGDFVRNTLLAVGIILIIILFYIIYIVSVTKYRDGLVNEKNRRIIQGFSQIYHGVFLIDLDEDTCECFRSTDPVATEFGIKEDVTVKYLETFMKYIYKVSKHEELSKLNVLINRKLLNGELSTKDYFTIDYTSSIGVPSVITISKAKRGEATNQILLGMSNKQEDDI